MDIKNILSRTDAYLREYELEKARELLCSSLEAAQAENDRSAQLSFLNELAGFYRDTGDHANAVLCAERSQEILEEMGDSSSEGYVAAMLNLANAYRAAGRFEDSHRIYDRVYPAIHPYSGKYYPAYYNNLALLYEDEGNMKKAADTFLAAVGCLDPRDDDYERRLAITYTNIAACLAALSDTAKAREYADKALPYFEGLSPSDFHYSALLAAYGDILYREGEGDTAADFYEAALSEILIHMGHNGFYDTVARKLALCYGEKGRPVLTGMGLSKKYFHEFGRPVLDRNFPHLKGKMTTGLFGEGSECFRFDDALSRDHDFGPSFCIILDDDVSPDDKAALERAYSLLPPTYCGYTYSHGKNTGGRRGVMYLSEFIRRILGTLPETAEDFQLIPDEQLACATNGEVFGGASEAFMSMRRKLKARPLADRYAKLASQLEMMSKHGEYNFPRMKEREDRVSAHISLTEFVTAAMRAAHLCADIYAPYSKWLYRSTMRHFPAFAPLVEECVKSDGSNIDEVITVVKDMCVHSGTADTAAPLAVMAEELTESAQRVNICDKIIAIEWDMFDRTQNTGGRAFCQDDWDTFSKMRRSQYMCFDKALLESIWADFARAANEGRNMITEKYAYMMRTTAPEEYAAIASSLPGVDEEKAALIEAIVPIQVGWMEEFAKEYPSLADRARVIHTADDSPVNTSYETYLRGELSTWSTDSVALYGAMIVGIYREGGSLVKDIMLRSARLYGYMSLEEAAEKHKGTL
ncbi:MAG: DUF4125 family protein [Oscillospiraceae bacterium]|nr:DUF4125 family protein [Oscillospiraceae bacterium]